MGSIAPSRSVISGGGSYAAVGSVDSRPFRAHVAADMNETTIAFVVRSTVGLTLLTAAFTKALDVNSFRLGINDYGIVPSRWIKGAAPLTILAECLAGIALLLGVFTTWATALALFLFSSFAFGIGLNLIRGRQIPCHCFGSSDEVEQISSFVLARALILATGCGFLLSVDSNSSFPPGAALVPSLTLVAGSVMLLRLMSFVPWGFRSFMEDAPPSPTPTGRVSFRHQPLDATLRPPEPEATGHPIESPGIWRTG